MKLSVKLIIILLFELVSSCVQETHLKTIHFKLDMRHTDTITKVGIRGDLKPLSWQETTFLKDDDNDSIYEGVITFKSAHNGLDFKFVNHLDEFELQGKKNRNIAFEYKPESIVYECVFNTAKQIISNK